MAGTIDPVCGMVMDPATAAATVTHDARTYYFCSAECAATFRASPDRYTGETMERHEPPFTRDGGLTAPKFGAAGSGGAEHEPLPERHGHL